MKFIIGTKQNMTQIFDAEGRVHPATVLKAEPTSVTQVKDKEKDGYEAVQVGYGERKEKNVNKAQRTKGNFEGFKEFAGGADYKVGDKIEISTFAEGDKIEISSISKGKGFQGVVKRHGFHGGRRSHGQKHSEREPGSIGATGPQRVFKGKKMGGRMGSDRVTLKKIEILQIDEENNQLVVRGAVPGRRGTVVEITGK
jgi:large subunit ribosomal protein L3